uniref:Uncharacterized protein n=1 Tax=Parascaris univalens TaxID=6257 RepID=A0A915CF96_PARUN
MLSYSFVDHIADTHGGYDLHKIRRQSPIKSKETFVLENILQLTTHCVRLIGIAGDHSCLQPSPNKRKRIASKLPTCTAASTARQQR